MSPKAVGERPDQDLGPPLETECQGESSLCCSHLSRGLRSLIRRDEAQRTASLCCSERGPPPCSSLRCLCPWQVKIMTEKELLAVACEQFLGKNVQDIKNVVLQTLEGHLRSILGEALPSL